jgi:ligand-binding SRPBCC domain-containing protein
LQEYAVEEVTRPKPAIDITSRLPRPVQELWPIMTSAAGVNAELNPLITMTFPQAGFDFSSAPLNRPLFNSWILLFGFLPFDRHTFVLHEIGPSHFVETSHTLLQKLWRHERYLTEQDDSAEVRDVVTVSPRLPFMRPLTDRIVATIFRHRHRRLARLYPPT